MFIFLQLSSQVFSIMKIQLLILKKAQPNLKDNTVPKHFNCSYSIEVLWWCTTFAFVSDRPVEEILRTFYTWGAKLEISEQKWESLAVEV